MSTDARQLGTGDGIARLEVHQRKRFLRRHACEVADPLGRRFERLTREWASLPRGVSDEQCACHETHTVRRRDSGRPTGRRGMRHAACGADARAGVPTKALNNTKQNPLTGRRESNEEDDEDDDEDDEDEDILRETWQKKKKKKKKKKKEKKKRKWRDELWHASPPRTTASITETMRSERAVHRTGRTVVQTQAEGQSPSQEANGPVATRTRPRWSGFRTF